MRRAFAAVLTIVCALAALQTGVGSAAPGHQVLPTAVPATGTPAVDNGQVNSIVQVGQVVVVGGTFSSVTPSGSGSVSRSGIFAFDAQTGALRTGFAPSLNGSVEDLLPGPDPGTVYAAGSFTQVGGTAQSHVTLLNLTNGQIVSGFRPASTNGKVNALTMARGRLVLGGNFTVAGGAAHGGLASLDPRTGALDGLMGVNVSQRHNDTGSGAQGAVGVRDLEATSDGSKIAAIGNFKIVDGLPRDQLVVLDVSPSTAVVDADWRTRRYEPYCFNWAFDTYIRGVAVAPNDQWFAVTTTGGHNTGTLCDTAARWEFDAVGDDIQPVWVDDTGGDTLWGVEVTENAVYVGGHQRWMNNSDASDTNGQGATPRPGLAALDVETGLPLAWNPGRNPRGAAAFALYATSTGLWVGSDTEWIGNFAHRRPRLAFFALQGGSPPAGDATPGLPGSLYVGGSTATSQGNVLYRVNAGGGAVGAVDGGPTWAADDGSLRGPTGNAAGWGSGATLDATVPASTPPTIFDSELWSPTDSPTMQWAFPVQSGLPLTVRLHFANRCTCTSSPGSRVFDVLLEGTTVLDDFDIVASVGDQTATTRSFDLTSDGSVDLEFRHVVENPLVNGIEIIRRDLPPPAPPGNSLQVSAFDGSTAAQPQAVDTQGIDWNATRGAFVAGGNLYHGNTDGYLYVRPLAQSSSLAGTSTRIDPYNAPAWNDVNTGSGNTFRGRVPSLYGQLSGVTGMAYDDGRLYFTLTGDPRLYWRWFSVDSGVVGSQVFTASSSRDWSSTQGMTRVGDDVYVAESGTGRLVRVPFSGTAQTGSAVVVDASRSWTSRALFVGPGSATPPANEDPTAAFTVSCDALACDVDGSGSDDSDGSVTAWSWDFGDGASATHTYAADGEYTITLEVTDDQGATDSTTRTVQVAADEPPPPGPDAVEHVAAAGATVHSTSPSVGVPAAVQAGDVMVLVGSYGIGAADVTTPAGWTLRSEQRNGSMTSSVWTRTATAADAGSQVTTPVDSLMKAALVVSAYRGVAAGDPLVALEAASSSQTASHTTPSLAAPAGSWVVEAWTDKSSSTTAWTPPSGGAVRVSEVGSGGGRISALLGDSDGAVSAGQVGGRTATVDGVSGKGVSWTIVLRAES